MKKNLPDQITASFSEEQTRKILERASEIDRLLAGRLSASAIREAAVQAGINEAAIEQAIREATSSALPVSATRVSERGWSSWVRHAMAVSVGGSMGFFARLLVPGHITAEMGQSTLVVTFSLIVASAAFAIESRGPKGALRYQINNMLLWMSFAVGWASLPEVRYPGSADGIEMAVLGGVASALIGAGVNWWRNSRWSRPEERGAGISAEAEPIQAM